MPLGRVKKKPSRCSKKCCERVTAAFWRSTYDYYATQFSIPPRVNKEGLRTTADFLAPKGGIGDIERVLDESLLDELEREGVFNTFK